MRIRLILVCFQPSVQAPIKACLLCNASTAQPPAIVVRFIYQYKAVALGLKTYDLPYPAGEPGLIRISNRVLCEDRLGRSLAEGAGWEGGIGILLGGVGDTCKQVSTLWETLYCSRDAHSLFCAFACVGGRIGAGKKYIWVDTI